MSFVRRFVLAFALVIAVAAPSLADTSIQIDAASDLQPLMAGALIPLFTHQTGVEVNATYDSPGNLFKQFEDGAPIDVFLSDDQATLRKLAKDSLIDPATIQEYAVGRLAVVLRPGMEGRQPSLHDLSQSWVTTLSIPDPSLSAYGAAAQDAMINVGIYDSITAGDQLKVRPSAQECSVNVQAGNDVAAITALSLVIRQKKANYEVVSTRYYNPIHQSLALAPKTSDAARSFVAFLQGPDAQAIFKLYGYLPPKKK